MSPSPPRPSAADGVPARFAALLEMGFERVEPAPQTTEAGRAADGAWQATRIVAAMGGFVAITALHDCRELVDEAMGRAFDEMRRLIGLLDRFDAASALSCLNDTGRLRGAPGELVEVVRAGLAHHALSSGAFDITVKPIIDLFRDRRTYAPISPPSAAQMAEALELVGPEHVGVDGADLSLARRGMGITLDGIAKGYIVDAMASALRGRGVTRFLINAGGDIRTAGRRGDGERWTVAVRDPGDAADSWDSEAWAGTGDGFADRLHLGDGAIATSGIYEIYFDRERTAHHIVEGRSGLSPAHAVSVTVSAPTATRADALATAAFVLGPQEGIRLIDSLPGCSCLIVEADGARHASAAWRGVAATESGTERGPRG